MNVTLTDMFNLDFYRPQIIIFFLIPACINLVMSFYVILSLPRNRTNHALAVFLLLLGLWQLADGLVRLSVTAEIASEWFRIGWIISLFTLPFGMLFIINYTHNVKGFTTAALFLTQFMPSLFFMVVLVARLDEYTMQSSGYWYWISRPGNGFITSLVHLWCSFQAFFMAVLLWINYFTEKDRGNKKKQAIVLAIGFTVPLAGGIVAKLIMPYVLKVDIVPVTTSLFTVASIAALIAMNKYKLLEYSPGQQWESIVEAMTEGLLIVNTNDEIMYANRRFCELTGNSFKNIRGRTAGDFLKADEISNISLSSYMSVQDKPEKYELQLKAWSGETMWVSMSVSPYLDVDGQIVGSIGILTDIDDLKKAETKFRKLIENSSDIILMTAGDGKLLYTNPAFTRITGYTMDDFDGRNPAETDIKQMEEAKIIQQKLMENPGIPIPRTVNFRHKDGRNVWMEGTAINLLHDQNIRAIVSNYKDVTESKIARDQLEQNEKRFKTLVENGNDAIAILDQNLSITYLSPNNKRIFGYDLEELQSNREMKGTHPEDKDMIRDVFSKIARMPGATISFEWRRWHKEGRWLWLEAQATNLFDDPNINGILINYRDITERKNSEEQLGRSEKIYKTIASSITGSVIIMVDSDYRYLLVEGDMLGKFGYTKEALLGQVIYDVIPPDRYKEIQPELERVFRGEYFTTETSRDGYDIITRFVPLLDEHNKVYSALMVSIDVTQIKQIQRELAELNKDLELKVMHRTEQLEAANKELESFSYSVSHDLRAPLRAIHGYTQILQNEYSPQIDEEGNRLMKRVLANTRKMGQLIDELLTFSRLGKKELAKHSYSMKDLVNGIVADLTAAENGRDIDIRIGDLPDVLSDSTTIKQVWTNLISNAIKYTRLKEEAAIRIEAEEKVDEVIYVVKDNGAGFDMNYVDKLFGVFQRLHSEEEFEGIGVGLAIVQRIVARHGGRVWAEGKEGEGATFYFALKKNNKQF